ncbi:hypothetical protein OZL92_06590 [Bacillus sonorensis]|uniref:Uncharacterized protein n=2 Tax=Bacillus sonorensis TaxID=119858 RepID=M5PDG3_9BACI|nr:MULTISPECIES: hypothetical protein [Bacillus]TWK83524.1 hypothetical protein CHCC20335_4595 [Bacillus paralicheniformis]ASB91388.1 hypothetical protein S101395_04905 [Bacillus sonorensis]EME73757.1 hypothetical protein BSONL12_18624 [Bacillus sonorensis L12]MCF7616002.1 hypothetical protein [Bacillus sonorensis]MCY7858070.1 hypothetical protein [Bacillus sonorensis]
MMMFILILTLAVYLFYSFSKDNRPAKKSGKAHQKLVVLREHPLTAPSNDTNC